MEFMVNRRYTHFKVSIYDHHFFSDYWSIYQKSMFFQKILL